MRGRRSPGSCVGCALSARFMLSRWAMTINDEGASLGRAQLLSTSSALLTQQSSFHSLPLGIPYLVTGTTYQSVAALHKLLLGITHPSTSHHTTCSQPRPLCTRYGSHPALPRPPRRLDSPGQPGCRPPKCHVRRIGLVSDQGQCCGLGDRAMTCFDHR